MQPVDDPSTRAAPAAIDASTNSNQTKASLAAPERDLQAAVDASAHAVQVARSGADPSGLAHTLMRHANTLVRAGRLADAYAAVDEAGALQQVCGAVLEQSRCLRLGATLLRLQGRLGEARTRADEALALTAGDASGQGATYAELGDIALAQAEPRAAVDAFDAAIATSAHALPDWRRGRARALALAGDFAGAAQELERAAGQLRATGAEATALRMEVEAATAWQQTRRFDRARAIVDAALVRARASGDTEVLAALALLAATDALVRGDPAAARGHATAARDHALTSRAPTAYIGAAVALSRIDEYAGDLTAAYGALASGWATLGDLLGADLARQAFEPLLRGLRQRIGPAEFDAARAEYETARRHAG